jgi:phage baseplate assembly protein W
MKVTLTIYNTISKVFYKLIDEAIAHVLSFPTGFPSEHFGTKCLHYIDEVQWPGAAQRAVSGAAAAALTEQSARVAVNKNRAAAQRKTAAVIPR